MYVNGRQLLAFTVLVGVGAGCPTRTVYEPDAGGHGGGGVTGGLAGSAGAGGAAAGGNASIVGTAGTAGGGPGGAGGAEACQPGNKRCGSDGLEACDGAGRWSSGVPCGGHQSCVSTGTSAQCKCNTDSTCSSLGKTCTSGGLLASCSQDGDGCFYASTVDSC